MIKAKPLEVIEPVLFEWDSDCRFLICHMGRKETERIRKKSQKPSFRHGARVEETDQVMLGEKHTLAAIKGWEKLTYKKLAEMINPMKLEGKPDEEISFDEENLKFLVENMTLEFQNFVWTACKAYNKFQEMLVKN